MKRNEIKRIVIMSVAAVIGMNLFACKKPETDKITIEFDKDLKTNEQKSKENETKQYKQRQLKKGESLDGKITGKTRIENGIVMEWQEEFPMDKEIMPIAIEQKPSENGYCFKYIVEGTEINAYVNNTSKNRTFLIGPIEENNQFATVGAKSKSNEQVLKSVAAADAIEKAMKKITK